LGYVSNSAIVSAEFDNDTYTDVSDDTDPDSPVGPRPYHNPSRTKPCLEILKDDQLSYRPQNLSVGDEIEYKIYVSNKGNVTLTNIVGKDDNATVYHADNLEVLNVGETATILASHEVTQADIDAGYVSNSAKGKFIFNNEGIHRLSDDT